MTLDDLVDDVALEVPDAPLATIRDMLRWAARELCTEADVWVTTGEPVVVAADTPYAELEAPSDGEPLRIVSLLAEGRPMKAGVDYVQTGPRRIEFRQTPETKLLYGELACRPVMGAMIPDELLSRWAEALGNGARYRLLRLPQPWQNMQLAEYYRGQFLADQATAKGLSRLGHHSGSARVAMWRFV